SNAKLVLCGEGLTSENEVLKKWIEEEGLKEKVLLLGRRDDIQDICQILDIFTLSSSFGEAFPLVVGEAMLTEVPCVVTDVGDSASLVGDTGYVVKPESPQDLADAWRLLYEMDNIDRKALGKAARSRIENNFELRKICKKYSDIYEAVKR
ncbi:MAG: glycosyltransferase, partial [Selenomonadaceae bacterium]